MRDFIHKIDNDNGEAGVVVADEYNSFMSELKNVVSPVLSLSESDNNQLAKSVNAISRLNLYSDSGVANDVILSKNGVLPDNEMMIDGMTFSFSPKETNTASTTIKLGNLPKRIIVDGNGKELKGGELKKGHIYNAIYKDDVYYVGGFDLINKKHVDTLSDDGDMPAHAYGLPAPLYDVELKAFSPAPADFFDGKFWGTSGGRVYYSENGVSWTDYCSTPTSFLRIMPTDDGEVLGVDTHHVRKSKGWATGNVTWKSVLANPDGVAASFRAWGFDGNGSKFIINHYGNGTPNWAKSRYVWISTDKGESWDVVYDTAEAYEGKEETSHLHAACYDKWLDRFWFAEGHGEMVGLYWSDDNGGTWSKLQNDGGLAPAFTVMVATDFGIVGGTDTSPNGLYIMPRAKNPETAGVRLAGRWTHNGGRNGLYGFADRGFRDPNTGIVYVSFNSSSADVPPVIMACGSSGASVVYKAPPTSTGDFLMSRFGTVVVANGILLATLSSHSESGNLRAKVSKYNATPTPDLGNIITGFNGPTNESSTSIGVNASAMGASSIAIGRGSISGTSSAYDSNNISLGNQAETKSTHTTAIGFKAKATGTTSMAIGKEAIATGAFALAIGEGSNISSNSSIGIGRGTSTSGTYNIVIGDGAGSLTTSSANVNSIVIGGDAKHTQANAVVIGHQSSGVQDTVCVGYKAITTSSNTVIVGSGVSMTGDTTGSIAIGRIAKINSVGSLAIGYDANATGPSSYNIAIGHASVANGGQALALGKSSEARTYGIAIGENAKGLSTGGIAIGRNAKNVVGQLKSIAIGQDSHAGAPETLAIGAGATTTGSSNAIALGHGASATGHQSVAIGSGTTVTASSRVSVGNRDLESTKTGGGIYLKSPNDTVYKITVDDDGNLTASVAS